MTEIGVDPNAINRYIAEKIIESALGERLAKAVDEALKSFGSYGADPLKAAVTDEIRKQVQNYVSTDHAERIREKVRETLTDEYLDGLAVQVVAKLTRDKY